MDSGRSRVLTWVTRTVDKREGRGLLYISVHQAVLDTSDVSEVALHSICLFLVLILTVFWTVGSANAILFFAITDTYVQLHIITDNCV